MPRVNPAEAQKTDFMPFLREWRKKGFYNVLQFCERRKNMPKVAEKQVVINEIKEKLDKAASVVLVNARGLTVEQDTILRRKLREAGVDYKVYKNTMINFAIEGTDFAAIAPHLEGPTTLAISYDDATAAARVISAEIKAMPVLEFKAGVIDKTYYDSKGVMAIANIPSREVLLSKLLGSFKSPLSTFARLVNQIAENKGNGTESAVVTEAVNETVTETESTNETESLAE